jgi:hypothetical protein
VFELVKIESSILNDRLQTNLPCAPVLANESAEANYKVRFFLQR